MCYQVFKHSTDCKHKHVLFRVIGCWQIWISVCPQWLQAAIQLCFDKLVGQIELHFDTQCLLGADTLLGPEMRSTGEVMGIDSDFSKAYAKAALAAGQKLPASGNVFVSMTDKYKEAIVPIAKELKASSSLLALQHTWYSLQV